MNANTQERRNHGFVIGLLTGTFVGAGLALWFAPRLASELRERVTGSARNLGTRVGEVVDELTQKGQGIRDDVAEAVARGAHEVERGAREVERLATAAKSEGGDTRKHSAADRSGSKPHSL